MSGEDSLLRWRKEFPILERTTYLISNSLGAMPRGASDSMQEYADTWATRGVRAWAEGWWRERAERVDPDGAWPGGRYDEETRLALVQATPWMIMAAESACRLGCEEEVADFGLELGRWLVESWQWDEARALLADGPADPQERDQVVRAALLRIDGDEAGYAAVRAAWPSPDTLDVQVDRLLRQGGYPQLMTTESP